MILFISPAGDGGNPAADWAAACAPIIVRRCPICLTESIVGHGRRRKQAHDESHDWIGIRRGLCNRCGKTVTFLPAFSLPYTHYSLIARSQALLRHFVDGCSLDEAVPLVKDPNRVPATSTLQRWFRSLDSAERCHCLQQIQPELSPAPAACESAAPGRPATSFPFLRQMLSAVSNGLARGDVLRCGQLILTRQTLAHFLQVLLPLRV